MVWVGMRFISSILLTNLLDDIRCFVDPGELFENINIYLRTLYLLIIKISHEVEIHLVEGMYLSIQHEKP